MAVDFDFVTPRLATGGALQDPADVELLTSAGITHIIDATTTADQNYDDIGTYANNPALTVLWNPTEDDGQHKDPSWFQESIWFGISALVMPHTKVFAHCTSGINRGPSTAFAIMLALGWDYNTAISMIHSARPVTVAGIRYAADAANAVQSLGY